MSSSSNQEKSDSQSLSTDTDDNRSLSSFHSRSLSTNTTEHSITGRPLPPPPDLSSLGSKLTTATMERKFNLPTSVSSTKYRTKSTPRKKRDTNPAEVSEGEQGEPWNCITKRKKGELEKVRREKYRELGERANPEDSDPFDRHIQRVLAHVIPLFLVLERFNLFA